MICKYKCYFMAWDTINSCPIMSFPHPCHTVYPQMAVSHKSRSESLLNSLYAAYLDELFGWFEKWGITDTPVYIWCQQQSASWQREPFVGGDVCAHRITVSIVSCWWLRQLHIICKRLQKSKRPWSPTYENKIFASRYDWWDSTAMFDHDSVLLTPYSIRPCKVSSCNEIPYLFSKRSRNTLFVFKEE